MPATYRPATRVIEPDVLPRDVEREAESFDLKVRGYDREQVEQRIHEWATAYDALELERDALLAELTQQRAQPAQLSPLASMSVRVARIVEDAEVEANEARAAARHEADAHLAEAQHQAADTLESAAQERSIARSESVRLLDEAQAEAEGLLSEAQATFSRVLAEANAEVERVNALLERQEEEILAGARLEAAELERTTARRRDIAEAEHNRLLAAHANQQKQYAVALRTELEDLEARRTEAEGELARLRQLVAIPTGPPPVAVTAPPVTWDRPVGTVASFADAPAPQDVPVEDLLHSGDTDEVPVLRPSPRPSRAPVSASMSASDRTLARTRARTEARNLAIDKLARNSAADADAETGALDLDASDETQSP